MAHGGAQHAGADAALHGTHRGLTEARSDHDEVPAFSHCHVQAPEAPMIYGPRRRARKWKKEPLRVLLYTASVRHRYVRSVQRILYGSQRPMKS